MKCSELKFEDRVVAEEIYWKMFGTISATNNEILTWIVHGFIAQGKGVDINWAKTIDLTTKKKKHIKMMQRVVGIQP